MAVLTASAAKGRPYVEGTSALYLTHDPASDNFVAGSYSHNPLECSATEFDGDLSAILFLISMAQNMAGGIKGVNKTGGTIAAGPVTVNGYDAGTGIFSLIAADPATTLPAVAFLPAALLNNATGMAYVAAPAGSVSSGLDQTAKAVGTKVYLKVGGGMTFTPDLTQPFYQVIGFTVDQLNPGNLLPFIGPPQVSVTYVGGLIIFPEVDLKTAATSTLTLISGGINIDEVGLILTTLGGTITGQPTYEFGITGTNAKYLAPVAAAATFNAVGRRERKSLLLADDRETALTFTITVGATGSSTIKGKPYVRGVIQ